MSKKYEAIFSVILLLTVISVFTLS